MTEPTKAKPKRGWYSDKESNGQVRYWDGAKWSSHRALRTITAEPIAKRELSGFTPDQYMGWAVLVAVLAGGAFALAVSIDADDEALALVVVAVIFGVISSIMMSIGVIGTGVRIGLREHMYDFEGGEHEPD